MGEAEIWRYVERQGVHLPPGLKQWVIRSGILEPDRIHCEADIEEQIPNLAALAESLPKSGPASTGGERIKIESEFPRGSAIDIRSRAVAEALAYFAGQDEKIQAFRTEMMDGRLLTPEEARGFCMSPALQCFSRDELVGWGVPLVRHTAILEREHREIEGDVVRRKIDAVHLSITVRIDPPGITREKSCTVLPRIEGNERRFADDLLEWPGWLSLANVPSIKWSGVWPDSVHDDLRSLSIDCAETYGWQKAHASWFVLTGLKPERPPIAAETCCRFKVHDGREMFNERAITLTVPSWVPPEEVRRAYHDIQRQLLGKRRNRWPGAKTLAVFRFVIHRLDHSAEQLTPTQLWHEWNAVCKLESCECKKKRGDGSSGPPYPADWRYNALSGFERAFQRAREALLTPDIWTNTFEGALQPPAVKQG